MEVDAYNANNEREALLFCSCSGPKASSAKIIRDVERLCLNETGQIIMETL